MTVMPGRRLDLLQIFNRQSYYKFQWCIFRSWCQTPKKKSRVNSEIKHGFQKSKSWTRDCHKCFNSTEAIIIWRRPFSYRNQSIYLLRKSMDWFLYDNGLRHERVKFWKDNTPLYINKFSLPSQNRYSTKP